MFDRFCQDSAEPQCCDHFPGNNLQRADCTLMEDPEERLDEEILNGVALRPSVNSETDIVKTQICMNFKYKIIKFRYKCSPQLEVEQTPEGQERSWHPYLCVPLKCVHGLCCTVLVVAICQLHKLPYCHKQHRLMSNERQVRKCR